MSRYLPIENLVYFSTLTESQVLQNLTDNIEEEKPVEIVDKNNSYTKPYIGKITGNHFEMKRAIRYQNSFLPLIKGEVYYDFDGTKIKVNMKPPTAVLIFITIWLGVVSLACTAITFVAFTQEFMPFFLIPYGMLLFGIVLFWGGFKIESSRSKKDLAIIFEAEIQE